MTSKTIFIKTMNEFAIKHLRKIEQITKEKNPLVAIQCFTYNHEPYLRETLEGFVMQQTNFPFVAIVHEDASTDGTDNILKEYAEKYPDIILPIFEKENQYSKRDGSLTRIMDKACELTRAKYIALCEGDDYWTDPLKLKKQVSFLENNTDYGLCYGQVKRLNQTNNKLSKKRQGDNRNSFTELISLPYTVPTCTIMYRQDIYLKYLHIVKTKWEMGDYPLLLFFSLYSKIKFLPNLFGVYRVLSSSASHFNNLESSLNFFNSSYSVKKYYIELSHKTELISYIENSYKIGILQRAYQYHNYKVANKIQRKCRATNFKIVLMKLCAYNIISFKILSKILDNLRQ